jgi:hypothetical protein
LTDQVNPQIKIVEDLFKGGVWDTLVRAQLTALYTAAPWLAVWPLKPVVEGIAKMLTDSLYEGLRMILDLKLIAFINTEHRRAFDKSEVALKIIAVNYGINSEEFKNARKTAQKNLADLVRNRG